MIDYIKIKLEGYPVGKLLDNPRLFFSQQVNIDTGEVRTTNKKGITATPHQIAYYNDLTFKVYDSGSVYVYGSLHKYFNHGLHNYNDFDINAIRDVLKDLKRKFDIEPKQCILKNIELGVNIITPIDQNTILDNCLLHKTRLLEYQIHSDEGRYKQCIHSQYIIKIYNKTLHYLRKGLNPPNNNLRFEIKFVKMQFFNQLGIYTLMDLLGYGLHNFKHRLLTEWSNVLYYDSGINTTELKQLKYSNPNYWTGLIGTGQRSLFYKSKRELKNLIESTPQNIKGQIAELISSKIDELNIESTQTDHLYIMSKRIPSSIKLCTVTGYDITMQKDCSLMISHTGIRHYLKNHYKLYRQLESKYLSSKWDEVDKETKIKEIAHNIRNVKNNQRIKQLRMYQPHQVNLLNQLII